MTEDCEVGDWIQNLRDGRKYYVVEGRHSSFLGDTYRLATPGGAFTDEYECAYVNDSSHFKRLESRDPDPRFDREGEPVEAPPSVEELEEMLATVGLSDVTCVGISYQPISKRFVLSFMDTILNKALYMTLYENLYYAKHLKAYMLTLKHDIEYARKITSIREAKGNDG